MLNWTPVLVRSRAAVVIAGMAILAGTCTACLPTGGATPAALQGGQTLQQSQQLQNGPFTFVMQGDGNLVDYVHEPNGQTYPLWSSGTWGHPGAYVVMQGDGNLVVYTASGTPIWASNTWGHPGAVAVLEQDGSLVVRSGDRRLWDSDPARYPTGAQGYDISWPQCGVAYPPRSQVAVVGVNDGRAFTTNPCVVSEARWAGANLDAYMNINSPGGLDSHDGQGPAGTCSGQQASCMAYNYGYNAADQALAVAASDGLSPRMWWLDVETAGGCGGFPTGWQAYWSCSTSLNTLTIQGAIDALRSAGYQAGIYCTSYEWGVIAGSSIPSGGAPPNWLAGDNVSPPASWCSGGPDFGAGQAWLLQLWPVATWDQDLAC